MQPLRIGTVISVQHYDARISSTTSQLVSIYIQATYLETFTMCGTQPCWRPPTHIHNTVQHNSTSNAVTTKQLLQNIKENIILEIISVGLLDTNCIILADKQTLQGCIIDAGGDSNKIVESVQNHKITVKHIYITHGHFDHFYAVGELVAALKSIQSTTPTLHIHHADVSLYNMFTTQLQFVPGLKQPSIMPPESIQTYTDNDTIMHNGRIIHSPGHSPGSVCLYFPDINLVSTGDTLFLANIGRTDLWGGNNEQLTQSILTKLYTLPEHTLVIPGHMSLTTIQYEKYNNMFVQVKQVRNSAL